MENEGDETQNPFTQSPPLQHADENTQESLNHKIAMWEKQACISWN